MDPGDKQSHLFWNVAVKPSLLALVTCPDTSAVVFPLCPPQPPTRGLPSALPQQPLPRGFQVLQLEPSCLLCGCSENSSALPVKCLQSTHLHTAFPHTKPDCHPLPLRRLWPHGLLLPSLFPFPKHMSCLRLPPSTEHLICALQEATTALKTLHYHSISLSVPMHTAKHVQTSC